MREGSGKWRDGMGGEGAGKALCRMETKKVVEHVSECCGEASRKQPGISFSIMQIAITHI